MRSDFLGDCSQFTGLPEALSRSQYLIPRLTREQRRQAIERPLELAGACPAPALVQQLLNDSADDARALGPTAVVQSGRPDPLPVLQHALMKTFEKWKEQGAMGPLELRHYEATGGVENALDQHAESIYGQLNDGEKLWAQRIFRCLTTTERGKQTRRATKREDLYGIAGAASEAQRREVDGVLQRFLNRDDSLLVKNAQNAIDIPHESLIWKWQRLQKWVVAEAGSAGWYVDLISDVQSERSGESGFWRDPYLARAEKLARSEGWNPEWAKQYQWPEAPSFDQAQIFLRRSRKWLNWEKWTWRVALFALAAAVGVGFFYWRASLESRRQQQALQDQVSSLNRDSQSAKEEARRLDGEVKKREELLLGAMSSEERAKLEKEAKELRIKAEQAQINAAQAKADADKAAKLVAFVSDLNALSQSVQTRAEQLDTINKKLVGDLIEERAKSKKLQDSLDVANAEIGKLRTSQASISPADKVVESAKVEKEKIPVAVAEASSPLPCTGKVNPKDGLCYVRIPAGKYKMGCSPGDKDCDKQAEKPVDVLISRDFSLGQTEVTQDAYQRVMKADPSFYKGALRPVHGVSWDEAKNYCASVGGRLPTEAEWEYAARAGSTGARYGNLDQIAWYFGNSNKYTHDVGGKLPNKWGLYDMLGNVWEWTADWYDPLLRGGTDPQGPPKEILKETVRVVRGGSWNNLPELVRASFRDRDAPVYRDSRIGFRCVRDLP